MSTYHCDGFRPVKAEGPGDAAAIFGARLARQKYGRRGIVRTLRMESWREDHRYHNYQLFIGRRVDANTTSGHDEWLQVRGDGSVIR